jgi:ABC-2 type transport system permease protein
MIAVAVFATFWLVLGCVVLGHAAAEFPLTVSARSALIVDIVLLVLSSLMMSQAISLAVQALYDRGDLDLLFSSPLRPWVVITARAAGIAFHVSVLWVALVTPFVITAALLGQLGWLALPVNLIALGLAATAVGLLVTSILFAVIGPRRTRTAAQILAGLTGGAAFLLSQLGTLATDTGDVASWSTLDMSALFPRDRVGHESMLAWPVRSLTGELLPLLGIVTAGSMTFAAAVAIVGPRFASMSASASSVAVRPSTSRQRSFAEGLARVMFAKELRLLARNPQLVVQVVLRVVYLAPLALLAVRTAGNGSMQAIAAAGVVLVAGQLAGSFAWIALSGEDAPDLLASAPIRPGAADHAKLAASLVPTAAITGLALFALAVQAPEVTVVVVVGSSAAALSSALLNLWQQVPARRSNVQRRAGRTFITGLAEFLVELGWALSTGLLVAGVWWGLVFALVAIVVTALSYRPPEVRHAAP